VPRPRPALRLVGDAPDAFLTVRDVATRLRISTATVYGLCRSGALPHARVSNALRIARADLEAFVSGHKASP
jgi:excisionase family DNA binding protein